MSIAQRVDQLLDQEDAEELFDIGAQIEKCAHEVGRAWCGSWLGYQSRIYYAGLMPPPPDAHFDRIWGSSSRSSETRGEWALYNADSLRFDIYLQAGVSDPSEIWQDTKLLKSEVEDFKDNLRSCFLTYESVKADAYMNRLTEELEAASVPNALALLEHMKPKGKWFTYDTKAASEGLVAPPHLVVLCQALEVKGAVVRAKELKKICLKAVSHMDKFAAIDSEAKVSGGKVFIGHGRSHIWRELKDFIQDRLHLGWDEFNRVPVAGVTTISRIETMLDEASFAFIVMTAEDEQHDARLHPRLNVVHEAGLFQGRLGFGRAIVLLEEGCEEFSNITGLGQIRFPKGNIGAKFEEIRRVLEREKLC